MKIDPKFTPESVNFKNKPLQNQSQDPFDIDLKVSEIKLVVNEPGTTHAFTITYQLSCVCSYPCSRVCK